MNEPVFKDEYSFMEYWCNIKTTEQQNMAMFCINNGCFLGVGRRIGSMDWFPMVETDGKTGPYIINEDGHYELAATEGQRYF